MNTRPLKQETGSAIIAVLIIAILLAAAFAAFSSWTSFGTQSVMHGMHSQRAVYSAQSGYYAALDWLKSPLSTNLSTAPLTMGSLTDGATYQLTMQRSQTDPGVVSVTSTGYFENPRGHFTDPLGRPAEMGVIDAQVRVVSVKNYFAAVPGTLAIAYGTDVGLGEVYGRDLVFVSGPSTGATRVGAAYYLSSVTPSPSPYFVAFNNTPNNAQQLSSSPQLPQVRPMQNGYYNMANDPPGSCLLPNPGGKCRLTGSWVVPSNNWNTCYCDGDLYLGNHGQSLAITGMAVVFVAGKTYIQNDIAPATSSDWMAVASEGDIIIDNTGPGVPHTLTVNGTFLTDGSLTVQGPVMADGNLTFNGGIISQNLISLTAFQASRTYTYHPADPALRLPYMVKSMTWTIRHGKNL